jgi:hypothetical protein
MKIRRSIAAGTLALTTVVAAGPLASAASAQAEPSTTAPAVVSCKKVSQQYRKVTRRLSKAARRLSFWQKVAAEMPARIEAQQAAVTDLQAQLAAATGDAAAAIQTQLDSATTKLAWMQAKLEASGRRVPAWTDAVARLSALQTTLNDQATTGNCPLPTTTTAPANEAGDDNGGSSSSSSTSSTVPGDDSGNDLGDDKGGERTDDRSDDRSDDSPSSTFEDRTAAERVAEAQRKAAERQAEAQRKAAERQAEAQRKAAERVAEAQKRAAEAQRKAAESGRRNRGGQSPTTSPSPTVDDRGGSSGRDGNDD